MIGQEVREINDRWKHRRWMAWITFIFDHLLILFLLVWQPVITDYVSIIAAFLTLSGAILSSYIGFSTWDDINKKREEASIEKTKIELSPQAFDPPSQQDER